MQMAKKKKKSTSLNSVYELTSLFDADQHSVQMRFQFVLQQFQAQDPDGAQCIVQVIFAEKKT